MEKKDIITLIISSLAFVVALSSFIISLRQKKRENVRLLRKQLSDTLNELTQVSVAFATLKVDTKDNLTNDILELRRHYNSQRRSLLNHADFTIQENPKIGSEIDFNLMATNWNFIGNYPKAEQYWELTIQKSDDLVIKHMNLRGFASFLFFQGNMVAGRAKYNEALELRLPDTENVRRIIADTYLMWARIERDFKFDYESTRLIDLAKNSCERITHNRMKKEVQKQIELFLSDN